MYGGCFLDCIFVSGTLEGVAEAGSLVGCDVCVCVGIGEVTCLCHLRMQTTD